MAAVEERKAYGLWIMDHPRLAHTSTLFPKDGDLGARSSVHVRVIMIRKTYNINSF